MNLPIIISGIIASLFTLLAIIQISGIYDFWKGLKQLFQKDKDVYDEGKKAYDAAISEKKSKGEAAFNQRTAMKQKYFEKYPKSTPEEVDDRVQSILELNMSPQDLLDFIKAEAEYVQSLGNDEETKKLQEQIEKLNNQISGGVPSDSGGSGGSGESESSGGGSNTSGASQHPVETIPGGNGVLGAKCGTERDLKCYESQSLECVAQKCAYKTNISLNDICLFDYQCSSGRCKSGKCMRKLNSVGENGDCDNSDECKDTDMICSSNKCIKQIVQTPIAPVVIPEPVIAKGNGLIGSICGNGQPPCIPGSSCRNSKCTEDADGSIGPGNYCATSIKCKTGLICKNNICSAPPTEQAPVTPVGIQCGPGKPICPPGQYCSEYGWCGTGPEYNNNRSQILYNGKGIEIVTTASVPRCGPNLGICPKGKCCSKYGYCDTTPAHCDESGRQRNYESGLRNKTIGSDCISGEDCESNLCNFDSGAIGKCVSTSTSSATLKSIGELCNSNGECSSNNCLTPIGRGVKTCQAPGVTATTPAPSTPDLKLSGQLCSKSSECKSGLCLGSPQVCIGGEAYKNIPFIKLDTKAKYRKLY